MSAGAPRRGSTISPRPSSGAWRPDNPAPSGPTPRADRGLEPPAVGVPQAHGDRSGCRPEAFVLRSDPRLSPAPVHGARRRALAIGGDLVDLGDQREIPLGQAADIVSGHLDPDRTITHDDLRVVVGLLDQAGNQVDEFHGPAERRELPGPHQHIAVSYPALGHRQPREDFRFIELGHETTSNRTWLERVGTSGKQRPDNLTSNN